MLAPESAEGEVRLCVGDGKSPGHRSVPPHRRLRSSASLCGAGRSQARGPSAVHMFSPSRLTCSLARAAPALRCLLLLLRRPPLTEDSAGTADGEAAIRMAAALRAQPVPARTTNSLRALPNLTSSLSTQVTRFLQPWDLPELSCLKNEGQVCPFPGLCPTEP